MKVTAVSKEVKWDDMRGKTCGRYTKRWVILCRSCIKAGLRVFLYEASESTSKYFTVTNGKRCVRVRVASHAPSDDHGCDISFGHDQISVESALEVIKEKLGVVTKVPEWLAERKGA